MSQVSSTLLISSAMRNARLARVLTRREALDIAPLPAARFPGQFALCAEAPHWFLSAVDETGPVSRHLTSYLTADRRGRLVLGTFQFGQLQLRCVFPLGEHDVRQLLTDSFANGVMTMLLRDETKPELLAMSIPFELKVPERAAEALKAGEASSDLAPAVQLTALSCAHDFCPSLAPPVEVTDVLTLLAANPSEDDMQRALGPHLQAAIRSALH